MRFWYGILNFKPHWIGIFNWRWATKGEILKLLGNAFGSKRCGCNFYRKNLDEA
jgi:hypothetical protein